MDNRTIVFLVALIIEWIFGSISKKKKIKTDLIPYQNLLIGIVITIIMWIITKDFNKALAVSGLFAGGVYDLVHNIKKMEWYQKGHKKN